MGKNEKITVQVQPLEKKWLSSKEAMKYLGCSIRFLKTLREKAEVNYSQMGKMTWYELKSIDRFLERNRVI